MSSRNELVRDMALLAVMIVAAIAVLLAGALWFGGVFSWIWLARGMLVAAGLIAALELLFLERVWSTAAVRGGCATWRRRDRTQGCSIALVLGLVAGALVICGAALWWAAAR